MHVAGLSRGFDEEWAVEDTMQGFDDRVLNAECVEVEEERSGVEASKDMRKYFFLLLGSFIQVGGQRFIRKAQRGA